MSHNPLAYADSDLLQRFGEVSGQRRYLVRNTPENLEFVTDLYNDKLNPLLIDFDTVEVTGFSILSHHKTHQRVSVYIKYLDPLGKSHEQMVELIRYNLREVLIERLSLDDGLVLLECPFRHKLGILSTIRDKCNISISTNEMNLIPTEDKDIFILESDIRSYGWYNDVRIKLI